MQFFNDLLIYLFHPNPGKAFQYYYFVGTLVVLLAALGIFIHVYIKKSREDKSFRKLFRRYPSKLWTLAISLGLYLLIRYNQVPFFSMRFLFYVLLALTIYLLYLMINTYLKSYPAEKKRREERTDQNRYMMKQKKKRGKR